MPKSKTYRRGKHGKRSSGTRKSPVAKHGGKNYKSVELHYNKKAIKCDVCGTNNYYQRDATLGRSKAANYLYASALSSLSVFSLFCNECGLARILKKENIMDKDNNKYVITPIKDGISIEDNMRAPYRPMKF